MPACSRNVGSSEPVRSARRAHTSPSAGRPARVSAQPSASAERMLGATATRAGRARPRATGEP